MTKSNSTAIVHDSHLRVLLEHIVDVAGLMDATGNIDYVSPSIGRVLGYTEDEVIGDSVFAYVHPDDVHQVRCRFDEVTTQPNAAITIETRLRHKDGSW